MKVLKIVSPDDSSAEAVRAASPTIRPRRGRRWSSSLKMATPLGAPGRRWCFGVVADMDLFLFALMKKTVKIRNLYCIRKDENREKYYYLELMILVQAIKIRIISTMYGESWNMDCPFFKANWNTNRNTSWLKTMNITK